MICCAALGPIPGIFLRYAIFLPSIASIIALGYKQSDVEKAMKVLSSENLDTNGYVKRALALLTQ